MTHDFDSYEPVNRPHCLAVLASAGREHMARHEQIEAAAEQAAEMRRTCRLIQMSATT